MSPVSTRRCCSLRKSTMKAILAEHAELNAIEERVRPDDSLRVVAGGVPDLFNASKTRSGGGPHVDQRRGQQLYVLDERLSEAGGIGLACLDVGIPPEAIGHRDLASGEAVAVFAAKLQWQGALPYSFHL